MIWKRYQNELIVFIAILFMVSAYLYKGVNASKIESKEAELAKATIEASEIISLQKQWNDPKLSKRILKLKESIPPQKIKSFVVKRKKLTASFQNLTSKEMNSIVIRLENIAVQIIKLKIKREEREYKMEIKCKW
ncbi:hypothetical protein MNB_SV-6-702 [hydrothermal vent metagenome]|uniref:Uncharacterized protein n=1 Tax=hydrothermal vent metagenome TaxID=652676 RepID=A0A1W1BUV3_9ZZZZ